MVATPPGRPPPTSGATARPAAIYDPDRAAAADAADRGRRARRRRRRARPTSTTSSSTASAPRTMLARALRHRDRRSAPSWRSAASTSRGDSHSNYLKTAHSLASTFYMDYLDLLADDPRLGGRRLAPDLRDARRPPRRAVPARRGATTILQFGSWWVGTHDSAVADENHPHGFSEFDMLLPAPHHRCARCSHLLPDPTAALAARLGQRAVPAGPAAGRGDQGDRRGATGRSTSSPTSWCRTTPTSSPRTAAA